MNDEFAVIENHNSQTISTYKKRLKAQKQLHNSTSPLRDLRSEQPRPGTDARPTLDLQYNLIRVQEPTLSKAEDEATTRATVGGTAAASNSSKTLENMLNNCCVLVNIKQYEPKQPLPSNKPRPPPLAVPNTMRRAGSQNFVSEANPDPKLSTSASKEEPSTPGKPKDADLQELINQHNQNYKRNRSSSANRKYRDKPSTAETSGRNKYYGDRLLAFPPGTLVELDKGKKRGQLLTSFKEMINKNPFKNFGKKRTPEAKETPAYACDCTNDRRYKKVVWESTTSCVRSVGWLRNKYSPTAAHAECKAFFEAKVGEKALQAATKDQISKDVIRTFNHNKYLSQEAVKKRLERLLECVAVAYPHTGYVQGMNYIAGTLLYHCDEFTSLGVIRILFEQLELKDIFLPSSLRSAELPGLGRHIGVIDTLILLELQEIYDPLSKHKISAEYFCTDWLMCLGLNIIPLEYSVRVTHPGPVPGLPARVRLALLLPRDHLLPQETRRPHPAGAQRRRDHDGAQDDQARKESRRDSLRRGLA